MTGYKNPPKESQFKKGQSGNLKGRPKRSTDLGTELMQLLNASIPIRENGKSRRVSRGLAMFMKLYDQAVHGDIKSATTLANFMSKLKPEQPEKPEPTDISESGQSIIEDFLRRNKK
jgi:hypothetical protein